MRKMSDYADTNPPATDTPNGTFKNETEKKSQGGQVSLTCQKSNGGRFLDSVLSRGTCPLGFPCLFP